jgi:hypothetical protein
MTETSMGRWHSYSWVVSSYTPTTNVGVMGLGFIPQTSPYPGLAEVQIGGISGLNFAVIDLTESESSPDKDIMYKGGIQSIDKGFSAAPILIPIPEEFSTGFDIGFIESSTITISGVWFDGLDGRDAMLEDLRTSKKIIHTDHHQSPLVFLLSSRAYPVFVTGYSSNIIGGQGKVISIRLGLSISSFNGHYNYSE